MTILRRTRRAETPRRPVLAGVLTGIGAGAGLMYLFDPAKGRRRRGVLRDKLLHYLHKSGRASTAAIRNMRNHVQGTIARRRPRATEAEVIDGDILAARVRAVMGHVVTHPRSVEVAADHGRIVLRGSIPADELAALRSRVAAVPGVTQVEDHLVVHAPQPNLFGMYTAPESVAAPA